MILEIQNETFIFMFPFIRNNEGTPNKRYSPTVTSTLQGAILEQQAQPNISKYRLQKNEETECSWNFTTLCGNSSI